MNGERVSISELAKQLNTSIATVSRALNNKDGVGEDMRNKVLQAAKNMGYKPNVLASGMRTHEIHILVVFPNKDEKSKYYTDILWQGYQVGKEYFRDHKIVYHECYFESDLEEHNQQCVERIRQLKKSGIVFGGGIVYYAGKNQELVDCINALEEEGVPILALHKKVSALECTGIVTDEAFTIGALAAEILDKFSPDHKEVLLVENNNVEDIGLDETSKGFVEYMKSNYPNLIFHTLDQEEVNLEEKCLEILRRPGLTTCFASTARASVSLGRWIERLGLEKKFFYVLVGRNQESERLLQGDVGKCLIDNNPFDEGKQVMQKLYEMILLKENPMPRTEVPLQIFFKANI